MLRLALLLVLCATSVAAQGKADRAAAFFDGWIAEQNVPGAMVVLRGREVVASVERGRAVSEPMEMASLSKAITAACSYALVTEGKLSWKDTVNRVLGRGPEVSLGALLTHSGGVWPDGTQGLRGVARFYAGQDAADVERRIRDRPLDAAGFRYNNENYALVALLIEAATNEPYEVACRLRALEPAGVQAAMPSPVAGASLAWGGWYMSVADYGRFHSYWFGAQGVLRLSADDLPSAKMGSARYGLGAMFRGPEPGRSFWHFGGACIPGKLSTGGFAVSYGAGWTVVAAYDACLEDAAALALSQGLTGIFTQ